MRGRIGGALLAVAVLVSPDATNAQYVRALSLGFTSVHTSGDSFSIKSSAGEPLTGRTGGGNFQVGSGFWYADPEAKLPEAVEVEIGLPTEIPTEYDLDQNYPNPFNPTTNIVFSLPERARARLEVYNTIGQRVSVLIDDEFPAGTHRIKWDARDETGRQVASGLYLYRLMAGEFSKTRTMILLK